VIAHDEQSSGNVLDHGSGLGDPVRVTYGQDRRQVYRTSRARTRRRSTTCSWI